MPSDHFRTGPKLFKFKFLFELEGHVYCLGAKMSPLDEGIFCYDSQTQVVAREPFDSKKKTGTKMFL